MTAKKKTDLFGKFIPVLDAVLSPQKAQEAQEAREREEKCLPTKTKDIH